MEGEKMEGERNEGRETLRETLRYFLPFSHDTTHLGFVGNHITAFAT